MLTAPPSCGLVRPRLLDVLDRRSTRLFFVTAPPGSGKTTLVAQYVDQLRRLEPDHQVAWYHAYETDTSIPSATRHLSAALAAARGHEEAPSENPDDLLAMLDDTHGGVPGGRALRGSAGSAPLTVVVDDCHVLAGSPAERLLTTAVSVAPPTVRFVLIGTRAPGVGFARHLLGPGTTTIGEDDVRLRSWEVADLFAQHYGEPFAPEDVTELTRSTEGWIAGLHLVHLATTGRPMSERRRAVAAGWARGRLARMYFAATVLDRVAEDVADFLVRSSVFGILDPELCDSLLERSHSAVILDSLAEDQLFTTRFEDTGTYRYHPGLQTHLEGLLSERLGAAAVAKWYVRAGHLLEGSGHPRLAVRAFLSAGDVRAVRRVLRRYGADLVHDPAFPAYPLPSPTSPRTARRRDPELDAWTRLAQGHRLVSAGNVAGAVAAYQRLERHAGGFPAAELARHARVVAEWWRPRASIPSVVSANAPWPALLRSAVARQNGELAHDQDDPGRAFVGAVSALLRGEPAAALGLAERIDSPGSGFLALAVRLLGQVAGAWLGSPSVTATSLDALAADAELAGQPWLVRVARAASAVVGRTPPLAVAIRAECAQAKDDWGVLIASLASGIAMLAAEQDAAGTLEDAADVAHRLGAGVLEAWARGLLAVALARGGVATAELEAHRAEACARGAGVRAARTLAFQAMALVADADAPEFQVLAETSAAEHGAPLVQLPAPPLRLAPASGSAVAGAPVVNVQCFGGFQLEVDGRVLELQGVRPRARAMLRMLACYAGQPVHEERLLDALWPGMPVEAGRRNLHVAVSALRKALEPSAVRGKSRLLRRTGTAYVLGLPPGSRADVADFRAAVTAWRAARGGAVERLRTALRGVLAGYGGELLPEDGPADWVVGEREELRSDAARAAVALAELELAAGDGAAAADAAEHAVRVDAFRDQAWRLLVAAHELSGDAAAATQTRQRYAAILGELGIATSAASAASAASA